ncbi:glycosyl hydrolase [Neolewinella persica]|uniref:glycosyl hydrolase n=1 Tax=Neolewinella persica TaxID=70998 RepID=UPI00036DFC5A|nr:glycosyl hydrolase [Neolewinella persica]
MLRLLTVVATLLVFLACEPGDADRSTAKSATANPSAAPTGEELAAGFLHPPNEAKPRTWFHAMSGNMSKVGLTKDLESMADVGIGGLLLFNVSQGIPVGDVPYNSDRHHEMITHAAAESERLGLSFGVHNCDGWSSSGGPWVRPEESMKMVVWSETIVDGGGGKTERILAQPTTREGYYRDIAILAYPSLEAEVEDAENIPSVMASDQRYDTGLVTDGKTDGEAQLGSKGEPKPWLQFSYQRPKTIRSASVIFTDRHGTVTLQKSDDGSKFEDVRELFKVRTGKGEWAVNDHFDPVTAAHFRLQFNQEMELREARLTGTYFIENPLGRTAIARTEDVDLGEIGAPPPGMTIDPTSVLNLTGDFNPNGVLTHDLPPGKWTILRFGQTSTGAFNNPASNEGRGLEVDKLSRPAFKKHYDAFVKRVLDNAKPVAPNAMQYVEIDSYEMGGQNWTDGFNEIFAERKGYDFIPFLPLVAGRFMGAAAGAKDVEKQRLAEAVLYDYREVISDLFTENYFEYFTELCHADGIRSYVEPYGFGPLNDLDVGGTADIPMGEFWMDREINMVESAVSAAHIYGKPVISAESFTTAPGLNWRGNPAMAKVSGDRAWAMGINEFMFHRFAHQANPNVTPGMTMNRWGFHFDRTQTWWSNAGKAWFRYITRGSYLLRQGYPVADLMIFVGDGKPNSRFKWQDFDPAIPKWINYDNVNTDVLINRASLEDKHIVLPEGGRYRMLALKNCDQLSLPTLRRLVKIVESGVIVLGEAPLQLAGYGHSAEDYAEFVKLSNYLKPKLERFHNWSELYKSYQISPDLKARQHDTPIYEHRRVGETDIYFLVNEDSTPVTLHLDTRIRGRQPERWNPLTGEITDIVRFSAHTSGTAFKLELEPEESTFIVFRQPVSPSPPLVRDSKPADSKQRFYRTSNSATAILADQPGDYVVYFSSTDLQSRTIDELAEPLAIDNPWQVTFRKENGFAGTLTFNTLTDWAKHPDERINYYSGTATYRSSFDFTLDEALHYQLDLGEVDIVAEVILNGKNLGVLWMPPFKIDVTDALRTGENQLEIEVTNLWSNRLIGEERFPKQDGGYEMDGYQPRKKMPQWYVNNEPVPPGPRTTFTTADFYDADDELFPSGLKGPVRILALKELVFAPAAAPEN